MMTSECSSRGGRSTLLLTMEVVDKPVRDTKRNAYHCANTLHRASARVNICDTTLTYEVCVPRVVVGCNVTVV